MSEFQNVALHVNICREEFPLSLEGEVPREEHGTARAADAENDARRVRLLAAERIGVERPHFPQVRVRERKRGAFAVGPSAVNVAYGDSAVGGSGEHALPFRFRFDARAFLGPEFLYGERLEKNLRAAEMVSVRMRDDERAQALHAFVPQERNECVRREVPFAFVHARVDDEVILARTLDEDAVSLARVDDGHFPFLAEGGLGLRIKEQSSEKESHRDDRARSEEHT